MKRFLVALACGFIALLVGTGSVWAQNETTVDAVVRSSDDSFIIKVNGSATVGPNESVDGILVVRGDITVDGTVREGLVLYDGTATINGVVDGDIVVVNGDLVLNAGSVVDDVMLVRSDIQQDPAATVSGEITESSGDFRVGRGLVIFSILWWIGTIIVGIVGAIIFAWLGRAQLFGAVGTLRSDFVGSLITAIVLFIGLPIVAGLVLFTLIGAPLGITIFFAVLPILLALGLIVIGTWIASYIIKGHSTGAAIGTAVLGVIILALLSMIPFVAFIVLLAGMLGAGALVYRAFRRSSTQALPQQP
ncbi:MAG: hypothetical protein KF883_08720 [Thermomicrobiales bacterium]|nr:hypothetical protein [Thermomicrobiales bacterium]